MIVSYINKTIKAKAKIKNVNGVSELNVKGGNETEISNWVQSKLISYL